MKRSEQRILTTHTGSLPRPPELTRLYVRRFRGEPVDPAELDRLGKEALAQIVEKQIAAGVDVGNNGEQQREAFFLYVRNRMTGFGGSWKRWPRGDVERYPLLKKQMQEMLAAREAVGNYEPPLAIGEVHYRDDTELKTECADFRAVLDRHPGGFVEPFLTAPSPGIIAAAMKNEYYDSEESYLAALGSALAVEYEEIARNGFLLQLDCPDLALERHLSYQDRPLSEFLGFVERVVATINQAIARVPRDRVRLHVCWGNYEGPHDRDVPLAEIWPVLRQANVGGFVLPFANPRHQHEYRVLAQRPLGDDQVIVAGVIDDLTSFVEHPEVVADRLENVVRAVGDPHRVMAGTDCGFDTSAGMGRVTEDVVWAKLAAMAEGARIATTRLGLS
ncbi:MAG: cobalamin-independent methionine synthase II family protein [Alphaproteobacteria bacterium]|nr:cobalamin-independent methionine synthase II family protein [Alphaproteobacteria bacterium]MBV9863119.1 cobalamin-independent methionine synthase II family protein [Alphaproteobacteria bacterium]